MMMMMIHGLTPDSAPPSDPSSFQCLLQEGPEGPSLEEGVVVCKTGLSRHQLLREADPSRFEGVLSTPMNHQRSEGGVQVLVPGTSTATT